MDGSLSEEQGHEQVLAAGLYGGRDIAASASSSKDVTKPASSGFFPRARALREVLREELENYELLAAIERSTGIRKLDLVSWFGALLSLSALLGLGAKHWCAVVGFVYPAYSTFAALAVQDEKRKRSFVRWITYWLLVAWLDLIELAMGDTLLQLLPFYYPFKFGFILWCQSPEKKGSLYIHSHILAPFIKCHEAAPPPKSVL